MREHEAIQTVIIGAGQAGLSVGYYLARRGAPFVILEANQRVGDTWRQRWDSLRLFTPGPVRRARRDAVPGVAVPFPTKDEMADYLEAYAARFALPVRTGVRVDRVARRATGFSCRPATGDSGPARRGGDGELPAAAGPAVRAPSSTRASSSSIHAIPEPRPAPARRRAHRRGGATRARRSPWRSPGRATRPGCPGAIPATSRSGSTGLPARLVLVRLVLRVVFHRVLTADTPIGRKVRPATCSRGGPLIRVKPKDLAAAGVVRVPRTAGVRDGPPAARRRPRARRGERHLVHGIRARLLVDRPAGVRRAGRAGAPTRRGSAPRRASTSSACISCMPCRPP